VDKELLEAEDSITNSLSIGTERHCMRSKEIVGWGGKGDRVKDLEDGALRLLSFNC